MTKSNFVKIIISTLLLTTTACSLPDPQKSDDLQAATFILSETNGKSRGVETTDGIEIPKSRTYEFRACLQDRAHLKPLAMQKISIAQNNQELYTDASGCLVWSENISFNYLQNPEWILIERTLEGQGYHKGSVTYKVAVNPWELPNDNNDVIDLKNISLDSLNLKSQKTTSTVKVFVSTLKVEKVSQKVTAEGLKVHHLLRIEAMMERFNLKSEKIGMPIQGETLKANVTIKNTDVLFSGDLTFRYSEGSWVSEVTVNHKSVSNDTKTVAEIKLLDEVVKPLTTASQFNLGLGSDWIQGIEIKAFNSNTDFSVNNNSNDNDTAPTENQESVQENESSISLSAIESKVIRTVNENESKRTLMLSVKGCLTNKITGKTVNQTALSVTAWDSDAAQVTTDAQGCFTTEKTYTFEETTCRIHKESKILVGLPNVNIAIPVYMYPWNEAQPVLDGRYIEESAIETKCSDESAKVGNNSPNMILSKIQVTPMDQKISVGNLLEMKVSKKIRWEMSPQVKIQGGAAAEYAYSPVRDETWDIEMVIQNPSTPSSLKKIFHKKIEVKSLSGLILWDTQIETDDLQTIDGIVDVYMNFKNRSGTYNSGLLRGRVTLGSDSAVLNVTGFTGNWPNVIKWAESQDQLKNYAISKTAAAPNIERYAQFNNLRLTKDNIFKKFGITDVWQTVNLTKSLKDSSNAYFCKAWLDQAHGEKRNKHALAWIQNCAKQIKQDFRRVFKTTPVYRIVKVKDAKVLESEQRQVTLSTMFSKGYNYTESWRQGWVGSAGLEAGVGYGTAATRASAGVQGGYEVSWMASENKERAIRQNLIDGKSILVSHYKMNVLAETNQRCMAVQINPQLFNTTGKKMWFQRVWKSLTDGGISNLRGQLEKTIGSKKFSILQKGILICEEHSGQFQLKDDYYILSEARQNTSLQNNLDTTAKPWFMAVRGQGDYQQLLTIFTSQIANPGNSDYSENSVQRLLMETNYFDSMGSAPQIWINPPAF